jgi:hypothetical protein
MARRRKSGTDRQQSRPVPAEPAVEPVATSASARLGEALRAIAIGQVAGLTIGWAIRLYAALFLGVAAVLLTAGWKMGPERVLHAREFASFTAQAQGRIVESWLAIEFDPARVGPAGFWRASARASACAIVEFEGEWGSVPKRAFCGKRLQFNESYHLHDLDEMTNRVPFDWTREANGFALAEVRFAPPSLKWLAATPPPASDRGPRAPATMLAVLEQELDRPDDLAIESRAAPPRAFALALDPANPAGAMPKGYVDARREAGAEWIVGLLPMAIGVVFWFFGMSLVLPALHVAARVLFTALPLLALPWWGDALPRNLARIQPDVAEVVAEMLDTVERVERLVASEPEEATLAAGEALRFRVGGGAYAETLGRFRFDKPARPARNGDEALAALVAEVTPQVRALPDGERAALFVRLRQDKQAGRTGAGLFFLAAAREAVLDERSAADVRQAAGAFLSEWVTQPVDEPWPQDAGFRERVRQYEMLKDVPASGVPILSASIAERALGRAAQQGVTPR